MEFSGNFVACLLILTAFTSQAAGSTDVLYYGWFFDESIAKSLKTITDVYFEECLQVPEFKNFIDSALHNASLSDPWEYYKKPLDPNTQEFDHLYHVTAKFCGTEDCSSYQKQVQEYIGRLFSTQLVGLYFTSRTFGIRVMLTEEQINIFSETRRKRQINTNYITDNENVRLSDHDSMILTLHDSYPGITFEDQDLNLHPTTSRAHVTIGCAPNISAVVTGTDLLEIIQYEVDPEKYNRTFEIDGATLIQYGEYWDAFVIYPEKRMLAEATFDPYPNSPSTSNHITIVNSLAMFIIVTTLPNIL